MTPGDVGQPYAIDASGPVWRGGTRGLPGKPGGRTRSYGSGFRSIPFIAEFAEAFPDATILVTGGGSGHPGTASTRACIWGY